LIAAPIPLPLDGSTPIILTAEVEDPDLPNDIITVTADLSSIGGPENIVLNDDGNRPDAEEGDMKFSLSFIPPATWSRGIYSITAACSDRAGGSAEGTVEIELVPAVEGRVQISERELSTGDTLRIEVALGQNIPVDSVIVSSAGLFDGDEKYLLDDGGPGDRVAGDGTFSGEFEVVGNPGTYDIEIRAFSSSDSEIFSESTTISVLESEIEDPGPNYMPVIAASIFAVMMTLLLAGLTIVLFRRSQERNQGSSNTQGHQWQEPVIVQGPLEPVEVIEVEMARVIEE
jgi:hypothetical protein